MVELFGGLNYSLYLCNREPDNNVRNNKFNLVSIMVKVTKSNSTLYEEGKGYDPMDFVQIFLDANNGNKICDWLVRIPMSSAIQHIANDLKITYYYD